MLLIAALLVSAAGPSSAGTVVADPSDRLSPSDVARAAYPEEPVTWYPALTDEPAAVDLASLWGLPLYRIDPAGQLRPALARRATVIPGRRDQSWRVRIELRSGHWSDGVPVTSRDVVATVEALRERRPDEFGLLTGVRAPSDHVAVLEFSRPYARWPYLLSGGNSVLPAHVIGDGGIDRYAEGVPVSGGVFRLAGREPGLRATFVANPDGPLGAPNLARIEVYFTPSYETSLGLLDDRRVDVVLGHLAVNPVARARRLEGVGGAAPLGGTWATLRWFVEGDLGSRPPARRAARDAIDLGRFVEGLLGDYGAPMTSTVPAEPGPWSGGSGERAQGLGLQGSDLLVFVPSDEEAPSFTARLLQDDLEAAGAAVDIARVDSRLLYQRAAVEADGAVIIRRDGPRPALVAQVDGDGALEQELLAGDAGGAFDHQGARRAQKLLYEDATLLPLYRVAVAHAWRERLRGLRASSWSGVGFWNARTWQWRRATPPRQRPAVSPPVTTPEGES